MSAHLSGTSTSDTLSRVRDLFEACVDLPPEARETFVRERVPSPDEERLLRALLAADARRDDPFATPAAEWAARLDDVADEVDALIGTRIGGFRLISLLGQGGSSVVFHAEREAGGAVQHVALKLMRTGLFSRAAQRRFAREQAILAQLSHPNIARLIDAGVSEAGIPWLAMELIEGQPLTDYARQHALALRARLDLVVAASRAVDAAHRSLIVHRDIKPSNVMVDASGRIAVLDFGIARALDGGADTATAQIALTPGYAAPEQYRGDAPSTAMDVYALGVVATELLLDARPLPDATWPRDEAGAAAQRRWHRLDSDLATVLRCALAADPAQRYASARHFAEDIERYLRNEPIAAHPPSRAYRARKFVARHRLALGLGVAVFLALIATLTLALWQRDAAQAQAARADSLRDFMFEAFAEAEPSVPRQGPATVLDAVQRALDASRDDAHADPRARLELRLRLAQVLQRQGDLDAARSVFDEVEKDATAGFGTDDALTRDAGELQAQNAVARGDYLAARSRIDGFLSDAESLDDARRAGLLAKSAVLATRVRERDRALRDGAAALALARRTDDAELLRTTLNDWGIVLLSVDDLPQAVAVHEELLALNRARFGERHQKVANVQAALARAYRRLGDLPRAEQAARAAVEIDRAIYPADDRRAAVNLNALLQALRAAGDLDGALATAQEALRINRATLGNEHPDTAIALYGVGELLARREEFPAALPPLREALAIYEARFGASHWASAVARGQLGYALAMSGERGEGPAQLDRAIADLSALADPDPDRLAAAFDKRVRSALGGGDIDAARDGLEQLAAVAPGVLASRANHPGNLETLRGAVLLAQQRPAEAVAALTSAGEFLKRIAGVDPILRVEQRLRLALALHATHDPAAAQAMLQARSDLAALRFTPRSLRALEEGLPR